MKHYSWDEVCLKMQTLVWLSACGINETIELWNVTLFIGSYNMAETGQFNKMVQTTKSLVVLECGSAAGLAVVHGPQDQKPPSAMIPRTYRCSVHGGSRSWSLILCGASLSGPTGHRLRNLLHLIYTGCIETVFKSCFQVNVLLS